MSADTPVMRQYRKIKKNYPDSILMFRLGDFYEMLFDDAKVASKVLGLALTSRDKNSKDPVPLCGVPYHSVESYITKLLESGTKVAICDQVENPKLAKGIVARRVTRVLTPGAVLDTEKLDSKTSNYIAGIWKGKSGWGLAYADISTGEFKTTELEGMRDLRRELAHIEPKEVLLSESLAADRELTGYLASSWDPLLTTVEDWVWELDSAREILKDHFGTVSLEPFGIDKKNDAVRASAAVIHYLEETQMDDMPKFAELTSYDSGDYLSIDEFTKSNLELLKTLRLGAKTGTLLWVLDRTQTAMGGRLLKQWINYPLRDVEKIRKRHEAVGELLASPGALAALRRALSEICDMERLIGRISTSYARPSDLAALRDSSFFIAALKDICSEFDSSLLEVIRDEMDELADIRETLQGALVDSPPNSLRDGGVIREGFSEELDGLRSIKSDGKRWISELETGEREKTGITSLKVGYNRVFGYYVEVTKSNLHLVPESYIRKQTLVNAERYITPELKEFEEKILRAEERIADLEKELFEGLRAGVAAEAGRVRHTAALIGALDVLTCLADVADAYDYVRPEVNSTGVIDLKESRHPVVERIDLGERFVPNDVRLDMDENQLLIITGPNMAGKSTLMRQVALIVIMAQMGGFIPARSGRIGVVDKIFTRVGASDDLTRGQSTFMVEMVETAFILRHATKRSLVIFDEIGRGTSTFDGMSLAWAVAEHIYKLGTKTLFATHYHELAELAVSKKRVQNYNIYVKEAGDGIVFLRKLLPGATSHSYGIEVARLAGVPYGVIKSARGVLAKLEKAQSNLAASITGGQPRLFSDREKPAGEEKANPKHPVIKELEGIDLESMTPIDALNLLAELKKSLDEEDG